MADFRYVIAGGGAAAAYACRELAARGAGPGEVALISEEGTLPYHRYPLSKAYLTQRLPVDSFVINRAHFYEDSGIATRLNARVAQLDTAESALHLDSGERINYERLLIATGARAARFRCKGADSPNLFYLRNLRDALAIRETAGESQTATLIGAGFTCLELGASLCRMNLKVTLVYMEERLMPFLFTERMHDFFARLYRDRGVRLMPSQVVEQFDEGADGGIVTRLESGEELGADFAVAGIGAEPAIEIARGAGIEIDDGLRVNDLLETGAPNVWAAGDVANFPDLIYGRRRRGEHLQNARDQGIVAARNMMGERVEYRAVPYMFSEFFEYKWELWGDYLEADEALYVGDLEHGTFSVWWARDGRVLAAFVMGRVDEERTRARLCVQEQREVPRDILQRAQANVEAGAGTG